MDINQITDDVVSESNRLTNIIGQVFIDENTTPEVGVVTLAISIGYAIREASSPWLYEENIDAIARIIARIARGQGLN